MQLNGDVLFVVDSAELVQKLGEAGSDVWFYQFNYFEDTVFPHDYLTKGM